jgi:hypothetical protein
VHPLWEKGKKWAAKQPNVVFVSTGQGMNSDAIMVSVHKDYADFVKFYHVFRRDWGKDLADLNLSNEYKGKCSIEALFIQLFN